MSNLNRFLAALLALALLVGMAFAKPIGIKALQGHRRSMEKKEAAQARHIRAGKGPMHGANAKAHRMRRYWMHRRRHRGWMGHHHGRRHMRGRHWMRRRWRMAHRRMLRHAKREGRREMGERSMRWRTGYGRVVFGVDSKDNWRAVAVGPPIASRDTVAQVKAGDVDNLNAFGTGQVAVADLLRFTNPSPVFGGVEPTMHGLRGHVQAGWSKRDLMKEGRFEAQTAQMLLRSMRDEARYRR